MNVPSAIKAGKREKYPFDDGFEGQLVSLCCLRPKFYARIGPELDPECLNRPEAILAMKGALAIFRELGRGPDTGKVLLQRLRRWMHEGKITSDDILAVSDMLDDAEDAGLPGEEGLLNEVVPLIKRRREHEILQEGMAEYAKRGDTAAVLSKLSRVNLLGKVDLSSGIDFGDGAFDEMYRMRNIARLKTGILELDVALDGGFLRGTEVVYVGGAGAGKSQALAQMTTASILQGANCGYLSFELSKPIIEARIAANFTGIPTNDILSDPYGSGALEKLDEIKIASAGRYGRLRVHQMTPTVSTVADVREWVKSVEEQWGEPMHSVVLDYADKIGAPRRGSKDESSYKTGEIVYEELRVWAEADKRWLFTASQGTRMKDRKNKKLDLDDVADSMGKVRVADYVVTLNPHSDGEQMVFFIAKNRLGKGRQTIGPLPTDFACARIAPILLDT